MTTAPPIIAVISALATDHQVRTEKLPAPGESLIASGLFIRCGGKGANTCVAAARLSRRNPARRSNNPDSSPPALANEIPSNVSDTAATANHLDNDFDVTLHPEMTIPDASDHDIPVQVRMIGAVGYDEKRGGMDTRGVDIVNQLQENEVDTSGVQVAPGKQTGLCTGIVDTETGENRLLITPGANLHLQPSDFLTFESLAGGYRPDIVVCNLVIPVETTEQILETASSNGISTLLNPSPARYLLRPVYRTVSHLILNETEAAILSDMELEELDTVEGWAKATDNFLKNGVKNVVITLGAKGAYYSNVIGGGGHVEAERHVNVVDSTGAGDTFTGAYAVQFVRQKQMGLWDIKKAVEFGCKASARTIEAIGAQESIPWSDDLEWPKPLFEVTEAAATAGGDTLGDTPGDLTRAVSSEH